MIQQFPIPLSELSALFTSSFAVPRRAYIRGEGSAVNSLFYLHSGQASTSTTIETGQRYISDVHLAGEIIGWSSLPYVEAIDTIGALTECYVSAIDLDRFKDLVASDVACVDNLVRQLCRLNAATKDRLINLGRNNALANIAAFIYEIHDRFTGGSADNLEFDLYMSQVELGEATGLTAVHINRILRTLREDGVLTVQRTRVIIHDHAALRRIARLPRPRVERTPHQM